MCGQPAPEQQRKTFNEIEIESLLGRPTDLGIRLVPNKMSAYKLYVNDHENSSPNCARIFDLSAESASDFHWATRVVALLCRSVEDHQPQPDRR